jgi:non-ribosomal peptide synthetase component F
LTSGTSSHLPEVPIQSVDFAAWQREQLHGPYLEEMVSYWKRQWSEFSLFDTQDLPFAKTPSANQGFMVETFSQTVDPALCADMRVLLREKSLSLHMLWLAALNILLYLYTQKDRIGVWGLFANRMRPETENLMGWFATGHMIGIRLSPDQEINALLAHVRDVLLEDHSYQGLPGAFLWTHFMKDIQNDPRVRRAPIQPHISFVTETETESQLDAFLRKTEFPHRTGGLALNLVMIDNQQDTRMIIEYSADRFTRESIGKMMADWQQIVRTIVDSPSAKVSECGATIQYSSTVLPS